MTNLVSTADNVEAISPSSVIAAFNVNVETSERAIRYYAQQRGIPNDNIIGLNIDAQQIQTRAVLTYDDYLLNVQHPIHTRVAELGGVWSNSNPNGILCTTIGPYISPIVYVSGASFPNHSVAYELMRNYPGFSTSRFLLGFNGNIGYKPNFVQRMLTSRPDWGCFFASHIDSHAKDMTNYSLARVNMLTNSARDARAWNAPFLIQNPASGNPAQYLDFNGSSLAYSRLLSERQINLVEAGLNDTILASNYTASSYKDLMGILWGGVYQIDTHDAYDRNRLASHTYLPGSICIPINSLIWSRYGVNFNNNPGLWNINSLDIHFAPDDFVPFGISGGFATTDEPGAWGFAVIDIFWWFYRHGYTLAESMWMAAPNLFVSSCYGCSFMAPYARRI